MLIFETWDIEKLIPYDRNPRKNDEAVDKVAAAIKEYGFRVPIVAKSDGLIVDGHLRFKAARKLGLTEIPVILADDLTDAQIKAFRLSVNKMAELADWDEELLKIELQELSDLGYDLELTGFDNDELLDFGLTFDGSAMIDESRADDVPDAVDVPIIKVGDLIELGTHRLLCGDSTKDEDVNRLMGGDLADMVFTDPPWNVNYGAVKENNAMGYKKRTILNDFMGTDEFKKFMFSIFENMANYSKNGCMTYVVMSAQEWGNMMLTLLQNNYHWSSTIIWNKDRLVMSRKDYHTKYEPIWYGWLGEGRLAPLKDRKQSDVWDIQRPSSSELHPTMKPVELVERAIYNSSSTHNIVLDLFGGSGTTIIASENISRSARLMELDEKYAEVIVQRWCDYTSVDSIKINGKEVSWSEYKNGATNEV